MIHGVENADRAAIIVYNIHSGRILYKQCPKAKIVSVNDLEKLKGLRLPISIDNFALQYIISSALRYIYELELEIELKNFQT